MRIKPGKKKNKNDEIKNNFENEIIYLNKKIATKRTWSKPEQKKIEGMLWSFWKVTYNWRRKERKKNKTNPINTKLVRITIHTSPRETGIAKKN